MKLSVATLKRDSSLKQGLGLGGLGLSSAKKGSHNTGSFAIETTVEEADSQLQQTTFQNT